MSLGFHQVDMNHDQLVLIQLTSTRFIRQASPAVFSLIIYNHYNALLEEWERENLEPDEPETWTTEELMLQYYDRIQDSDLLGDGQSITWYREREGSDPNQVYTSIDDHWKEGEDVTEFQQINENGDAGYWDSNGNDWVYTFFVFNKDVDWYAWEDPVHGYTISGQGTINSPSKINKEDINTNPSTTITNVNHSTEFGKIRLSKKIAGIAEYTGDAAFLFTIELADENDTPVADNTIIDGHLFTGGKTSILVKPGTDNNVILDKIPKNYKYRVLETVPFDYEVSYDRKVGSGDAEPVDGQAVSGTINSVDEITISATNTSTKEEKYVDLTLRKAFSENSRYETANDVYVFTVTFANLQSQTTYTVDGGENFTSDGDGNATVTFLLQKDQELVIRDLPVDSTYVVTESGNGYTKTVTVGGDTETVLMADDNFVAEGIPAQSEYSINKTEIEVPYEPDIEPEPEHEPEPEPAPYHVIVRAVMK